MKNKYQIIELCIIFLLTLIFNLMCNTLTHDEVWNYGFAYNIANGLIPYKDFNMVITPLFPILGAIFMTIFGKSLVIYHIFNAIICTWIFYYMKKNNSKSYYIPYSILLFNALPNYSLFCILLLYILIDMENKKTNDYLVGIFLGLTFLTKQNIGIYLCIPTIFVKNIKKIIKRMIGFVIPNIIMLIYLILNNCLYEFIDYTFLGISDFANKNLVLYSSCLLTTILITVYLIYKYIKTKDIKIVYLICFQGMAYPLIEPYHVILPFIVGFNYMLSNLNLSKRIIKYAFIIFILSVYAYNIYIYMTDEYSYPNTTNVYKYKKINKNVCKSIETIKDYIENQDGRIFIVNMYAYLVKLESNQTIDKFDLLNDGNLGSYGEKKIINEMDTICKKQKCTYLLNQVEIENEKYSQYNQDIYKYIVKNYKKTDSIIGLSVYTNY